MGDLVGVGGGELLEDRDRLLVLLQPLGGLRRDDLRPLVAGGEVAQDLLGLGIPAGLAQHLGPLGQQPRRVLLLGEERQRLVIALVLGEGVGLQRHGLEADGVVRGGEQRAQGGFELVPLLAVVEDLGGFEVGLLGLLGLAVLLQGGAEALEQGRRVVAPAGALEHPRQGHGDPRLLGVGVVDLGQQGDRLVVAPLGGVDHAAQEVLRRRALRRALAGRRRTGGGAGVGDGERVERLERAVEVAVLVERPGELALQAGIVAQLLGRAAQGVQGRRRPAAAALEVGERQPGLQRVWDRSRGSPAAPSAPPPACWPASATRPAGRRRCAAGGRC